MGKKLNLANPKAFTEKIQWLKLYRRQPEMITLVDKYAVKDYVADKIGVEYIIPTLGVWDSAEEIDWDNLPEKFVLKTTHGGGSGGVVICQDKNIINKDSIIEKLNKSLKSDIYLAYREWPYKNVPRRIIAEKYVEIPEKNDLTDYKIFCFNGKPQYIQVIQDRHYCETIDFFDTEWNHVEFVGLNPRAHNAHSPVMRPKNLETMLDIAANLSDGFEFVRIDLYQVETGILFGEITFFPASGFGTFSPKEYDLKLGSLINL